MKVRSGGFTEAEALALAWSRRSKEFDLMKAKLPYSTSNYDNGSREERRPGLSAESAPRRERRSTRNSPEFRERRAPSRTSRISRKERKLFERDSPNYSPYEGNIDKYADSGGIESRNSCQSSSIQESQSREWDRSCSRERSRTHAAHGRDEMSTQRSTGNPRKRNHRSATHSRSRSGSRVRRPRFVNKSVHLPRSRSRSRSLSRSRSRSRSKTPSRRSPLRSRSRSPLPPTWTHDKFTSNSGSSPSPERRKELQNYRPPSPTWVSRAGGVAIMRKKTVAIP